MAPFVTTYLLRLGLAAKAVFVGLAAGHTGVFLFYPTWNSVASLPYVAGITLVAALPVALCVALLRRAHWWTVPISAGVSAVEVYLLGFDSPTAFALALTIAIVSAIQYKRLLTSTGS